MPYDIHLQLVSAAQYKGTKFYSFGPERSVAVRGLQALVNMFVKYLLTPIGSDHTDLSYGTQLTSLLGSNVTADDAQDVLQLSVEKTVTAIQGWQRAKQVPPEERLLSATVTGFVSIPSAPGFAAQIYIQNVAGQGLKVLLPTLTVLS